MSYRGEQIHRRERNGKQQMRANMFYPRVLNCTIIQLSTTISKQVHCKYFTVHKLSLLLQWGVSHLLARQLYKESKVLSNIRRDIIQLLKNMSDWMGEQSNVDFTVFSGHLVDTFIYYSKKVCFSNSMPTRTGLDPLDIPKICKESSHTELDWRA